MKKAVVFEKTYRDPEFPAQCVILFRQSAEQYLDMECLAIGGTFLSGILIGKSR